MILETVRIGIVGAGQNTRARHIPNLKAIDGVDIASVCNRSLESSKLVAQEFGISEIFQNWGELVKDPDIDAVVIGTWPYMHRDITVAALSAGKHVLCEARMASNAAQARQMLLAAHSKPQLVAQLVPSPITLKVDLTIQKIIASGLIGQPLAVEIRDCSGFINQSSPMHWRQNFDYSGFNTMTLGIWYEAILRWLGEAKSVTAMAKTFTKMRTIAPGRLAPVLVPEHLDVIADMHCGAQLSMKFSSVMGLAPSSQAWIFGSEATLLFTSDRLFLGKRTDSQLNEINIPPQDQGSWHVEQDFIDAIRGKAPVKLTCFEDGLKYMDFTEAVAKSAASGKTVPLPLDLD